MSLSVYVRTFNSQQFVAFPVGHKNKLSKIYKEKGGRRKRKTDFLYDR